MESIVQVNPKFTGELVTARPEQNPYLFVAARGRQWHQRWGMRPEERLLLPEGFQIELSALRGGAVDAYQPRPIRVPFERYRYRGTEDVVFDAVGPACLQAAFLSVTLATGHVESRVYLVSDGGHFIHVSTGSRRGKQVPRRVLPHEHRHQINN